MKRVWVENEWMPNYNANYTGEGYFKDGKFVMHGKGTIDRGHSKSESIRIHGVPFGCAIYYCIKRTEYTLPNNDSNNKQLIVCTFSATETIVDQDITKCYENWEEMCIIEQKYKQEIKENWEKEFHNREYRLRLQHLLCEDNTTVITNNCEIRLYQGVEGETGRA